jgi:hypothetical protein
MKHTLTLVAALLLAPLAAWGGTAELKTERFRLSYGDDGRPASLRTLPTGEELLDLRARGAGFYLEGADHKITPLSHMSIGADGRLTLRSGDGKQTVVFGVRAADRYLALRIEKLDGIPAERGMSLHFELKSTSRVRVTELDYMTRVQNESNGVRVHWDDI